MTVLRRFAVLGLAAALLGCGSDSNSERSAIGEASPDTAPVSTTTTAPPDGSGPGFTLKLHNSTGETPFTQLAYECDQCTFEQFVAVEPPPGWSKGPTQVILPIGELRGTPSFDGVPSSMDFVAEIPGDDFVLIAKTLDGRIVELGDNGAMVVVDVIRDTYFRYPSGTRVHELADPEGNTFVLFAFEVESADFDSPDFQDADALADYPGPKGWTYSTRILDEDLVMESTGVVSVLAIERDPSSVWQQR